MRSAARSIAPGTLIEWLEHRCLLSSSPAISISDVSRVEGQGGATAYVFTVSLSKPSSKRVSVDFATADGSAQAGLDYAKTSGTLQFARGQTSKTITVLVNGDASYEPDETFLVSLSRARDAFIADAQGIGTIRNDDLAPPPPPPPPEIPDQPGDPGTGCNPDNPYYPNC